MRFVAAFALRRLRSRPLAVGTMALAIAGAVSLLGGSSIAAELANDANVRLRLQEVPFEARSVQIVYHLGPVQTDTHRQSVDRFFADIRRFTESARRVHVWHSLGNDIRLVVPASRHEVALTNGRLPRRCSDRLCEVVALAGFRVGETVALEGVTLLVVGRGTVLRRSLPLGSRNLPRTPVLRARTLLSLSLPTRVESLARRAAGSSVVTTAPLDPARVHSAELVPLMATLREGPIRLRREGAALEGTAPLALLDELAKRGDVARHRLLLVAGQVAALLLAFAAYAAAIRRREQQLVFQQLDGLAASPLQNRVAHVIEVALPVALAAIATTVGVAGFAALIATQKDLPTSFVSTALWPTTLLVIFCVTLVAIALLVASGWASQPREAHRPAFGAIELAAVIALGLVLWQVVATGALDAEQIAAGGSVSPILVLLPSLTFFASAVMLLRTLPLVLTHAERLSRRVPFSVRLGLVAAARRPAEAAAATTFLAVALGSALFAVNYRATLKHQAEAQADFTAAAAWRVLERPQAQDGRVRRPEGRGGAADVQPPTGLDTTPVTGQTDVTPLSRYAIASNERPAPVIRFRGTVREQTSAGDASGVELLAVPASRLVKLRGWRSNFSKLSLPEIARAIRPRATRLRGLALTPDAVEIRSRVAMRTAFTRFAVVHLLLPDDQRIVHLAGNVIPQGVTQLRIPIPSSLGRAELVGIEFPAVYVPLSAPPDRGEIDVGLVEQRRQSGWRVLGSVEDWTSAGGHVTPRTSRRVERGLRFELRGTATPLIHPRVPDVVPALVSGDVARLAVDDRLSLAGFAREVPIQVIATASLFPSVLETPRSFIIVDYDTLFAVLNAGQPGIARPGEAWFFRRQSPDFLATVSGPPLRADSAVGVDALKRRLLGDPVATGARSVLLAAAVVAALVSILGLIVATRSSLVSERLLLAEYEALGVPPTVLRRSMQIRLVCACMLGVLAGILGGLLALLLVSVSVAITGEGGAPLPPIEPVVDWLDVAIVVGAVAAAAVTSAWLLARRATLESAAGRLRA